MWRVERLVYHDFIPDPLGPSHRGPAPLDSYPENYLDGDISS